MSHFSILLDAIYEYRRIHGMIELKKGSFLVEHLEELPAIPKRIRRLFMDVETRNFIAEKYQHVQRDEEAEILCRKGGTYVFGGSRICGLSFSFGLREPIYYVPVRHLGHLLIPNLDPIAVFEYIQKVMNVTITWVNHNVNFDAQFLAEENVTFDNVKLECTLVLSKILDSDRMSHELKDLARSVLRMTTEDEAAVKRYVKSACGGEKWSNYAVVPPDILGAYANEDVNINKVLYVRLLTNLAIDQFPIWDTERKLTEVLYDMEHDGMMVNVPLAMQEVVKAHFAMIKYSSNIAYKSGIEFTDSNKCLQAILLEKFGLPVLMTKREKKGGRYIDTGRPTFEKEALSLYQVHPAVVSNPEAKSVVDSIVAHRAESNFKSLFGDTVLALRDKKDIIHPSYNQIVRTGRMSAKNPNSQQQNKRSKALIRPRPGYSFVSMDYSQVEFRLIAHYIKDEVLIAAYNNDASTDFHQWVAELIHVSRKVGKTLNFAMAYGAGKAKVIYSLTSNPDIIEEMSQRVQVLLAEGRVSAENANETYLQLCKDHSEKCYAEYHERLPGLRRTAEQAKEVCAKRGYVRNAYGRRRYLSGQDCRKAFNSIVQGTAMDMIKERMNYLSPRNNKISRDIDLHLVANVHDEVLFELPTEYDQNTEVLSFLVNSLQTPDNSKLVGIDSFRIPFRVDGGFSRVSWAEAGLEHPVMLDGVQVGGVIDTKILTKENYVCS